MTNEQSATQTEHLIDNFNRLDEKIQDKLLNGVKCLAFLHDLADTNDDDKQPSNSTLI